MRIFEGLFGAAAYIDLRRLPELICGFSRLKGQGPTFFPVACSPQAWASASPLLVLQSCLGLSFKPQANQIVFTRPTLPEFLDEVILRRLTLGGSAVDVAAKRMGTEVVIEVLSRSGDVEIVTLG